MRNTVDFVIPTVRWPEESDEREESFSDILLAKDAAWFVDVLRRIDWIVVDAELCQEDWGVVAFVRHDKLRFHVGLSFGGGPGTTEVEGWHAWVRHGSFTIKQRFTQDGKQALRRLVLDLDRALRASGASELAWYDEADERCEHPSTTPE